MISTSTWKARKDADVRLGVFSGQGKEPGGECEQAYLEGPAIPRWLSALHRLVTVAVFVAICLATVALVATLVRAGRSCYERTVHTARNLTPAVASLHSAPDEQP
jgi:hypothetical protein